MEHGKVLQVRIGVACQEANKDALIEAPCIPGVHPGVFKMNAAISS